MQRRVRKDGQRICLRIALAVWVIASLLRDLGIQHSGSPFSIWATRVAGLTLVAMLVAEVLVSRWEEGEDGLVAYDLLNRVQWRIPYAEIRAYLPAKGFWLFLTKDGAKGTTSMDQADVHRIMAAHAPKALQAKRWKCGQVPPPENIQRGLLDFRFPSLSLGMLVGVVLAYLFEGARAKDSLSLYLAVTIAISLFAYDIRDLFGSLELTSEGISARWPWESRTIGWDEITAIFMEGTRKDRRFVVTSAGTSIIIPHPVATELDPMRKLFYSIPQGTLCVNFDETFRKGFRRRRRRGLRIRGWEPAADRNLAPAGL